MPDILQSHGDGCYSSKIGQASSLEDEFASKASLGGCEKFKPTAEESEDSTEDYSDDCDDSDDSEELIIDQYSSEDNDGEQGRFLQTFIRTLLKEGQEVDLPANLWYICLKDDPPEGCDPISHHLNLLEQVVGSDAKEVYTNAFSDTKFTAVLTDEEHEKFIGMGQVESSCIAKCWFHW
ncbi:uncharacterized protein LOC141610729 isoform X2 [Silene latifolia]|uniref:uncharacterized protein LOC141610729 isoform X2 n=1 Tax=Silene latifolia TaxID=37657 RepID=UPI003D7832E4